MKLGKKNLWLCVLTVVMTVAVGAGLMGAACAKMGPKPQGVWLSGDFHQHTNLTDGSHPMPEVFTNASRYGLDWWANSEHGGAFARDTYGTYFDTMTPMPLFLGDPNPSLENGHLRMWRWQSLMQYSFPVLQNLRAMYPGKKIIQGYEWNVPGHEHCSVGIVADTVFPIAQFEYLFDASDKDATGGKAQGFEDPANLGVAKNPTNDHAKAVAAVRWLQERHTQNGWYGWTVFAHVERRKAYKIEHFRDFNNAAPDVAFGFESIPGHQKEANRGSYSASADGGGTYGGAGKYVAKVGDVWDALLGEGRRWFVFVSSDFHDPNDDFWPGEYAKTWTFVKDLDGDGRYSHQEIAKALRTGASFCVHGDLINALDFHAQYKSHGAAMGEELQVEKGRQMKLTIRFKSPAANNNGDTPHVDHIDLIAGPVTAKAQPGTPAYLANTNPAAKVIARFTAADWETDADGWNVIQHHVQVNGDMYFRIRGTNQSLVDGELEPATATNNNRDPLLDIPGQNTPEKAWADLWFYSNPIFVKAVAVK
jgi:hypothetical protein